MIRAAPALLVAVLLAAGARADLSTDQQDGPFYDFVTWKQCETEHKIARLVGPLPDHKATVLSLSRCDITELKPGDFDGLPNVKTIMLTSNKLKHVDPNVFTAVNGVELVSLSENKLSEVPNFGALSLFPNMTLLFLDGNDISKLGNPQTFSSMKRLKWLDLKHNHIAYLHPDIFKPLINLELIFLSWNELTYIPDNIFHIPSLQSIQVDRNHISYVAPGAINSSHLRYLNLRNNTLSYLPEHFVLRLKNISADFIGITLNENPWQCGCLQELAAEATAAGVRYVYKSGVVECGPAAAASRCDRPIFKLRGIRAAYSAFPRL